MTIVDICSSGMNVDEVLIGICIWYAFERDRKGNVSEMPRVVWSCAPSVGSAMIDSTCQL
jgi:hypothetical protein